MTEPNPKVDFCFAKAKAWAEEMRALRAITLSADLTEDLKWGCPCYTLNGANIVLIHAFKDYCALLFMKGALLEDPDAILIQQTANVQAGRQIRFTSAFQIAGMAPSIRNYIDRAIAAERAGLKVEMPLSRNLTFSPEVIDAFDADPDLKAAFDALTPGRQRAWNLNFTGARQSATRTARIVKATPQIMAGKGPDDR